MKIAEHIRTLDIEGRLLADAAQEAGTGAPVPTCPGWQVRDLLRHTATVHTWAAAFVTEGHTSYVPDAGEPDLDGPELLDRFRAGHRLLVDALERAPQDLECWAFFAAPSPLAFWARRQAHETAIHRVDAESARGGPLSPVASDHAVDGVDELLRGFHARPKSRVRTDAPRALRVRATDTGAVWTVRLSTEPPATVREEGEPSVLPPVDCELSATAQELYLTLWNRLPLTTLTVTGDPDLARLWRDSSSVI
ncbi:maleylpyruvate isomerase family mycothiol-dependent enzyme [Streptomyces poriferorum]|uniref:Maleylpyruvate isomerase family mycothiol-dependent enzyme n=1 Tax=Streptomyces poriferorum TaxID=2798799 RepID=A0ABY9IZY0_9ACTN|nr:MULTISPECIES: maleylpyruvate isomerase family mycothiol-dependent enzyme [unclassified Streptomyces]MDP5309943.1 maleylpyruvate isomerase family mycothiol-dependent enzyme [Streptomyces sp. Alt4]WLQ60885.1 maleylpyruvate isomerase family mycothiol-dependent enzyme [Streptomyces sp. Alt2]